MLGERIPPSCMYGRSLNQKKNQQRKMNKSSDKWNWKENEGNKSMFARNNFRWHFIFKLFFFSRIWKLMIWCDESFSTVSVSIVWCDETFSTAKCISTSWVWICLRKMLQKILSPHEIRTTENVKVILAENHSPLKTPFFSFLFFCNGKYYAQTSQQFSAAFYFPGEFIFRRKWKPKT